MQSFLALTKYSGSRYYFKVWLIAEKRQLFINAIGLEMLMRLSRAYTMPVVLKPTAQGQHLYIYHAYIPGLKNGERWDKDDLLAQRLWLVKAILVGIQQHHNAASGYK